MTRLWCLVGIHAFGAWAPYESDGQIVTVPFIDEEPIQAFHVVGERRICAKCGKGQTRVRQEEAEVGP